MNARVIILSALAFAIQFLQVAQAQQPEILRFDIVKSSLSILGKDVVQVRVDFNLGASAPMHKHPGEEIAFVLTGTIEYQLRGREAVILKAGQALFIPSGVPHSAKNVGNSKASELATYIVDAGAPLVELEK
jgi:quercetin dioxygenase-like cupin family protein